jgi:hypothetical protein
VSAPIDEPTGATVMPGTPIGSPTDELTTPPTSVDESDDSNTTSFPVAENEPGDSVYQSDNDYEIGTSDGGPGVWAEEPISAQGAEYQEQVTGAPQGTAYVVPAPGRPSGEVSFDGYDPERNVLIDAKDWTDWPATGNNGQVLDFARNEVVAQAQAQADVAQALGIGVEWHVPTPEKAEEIRRILEDAEIYDITIVVTPKD